jgi:hypothetical protein
LHWLRCCAKVQPAGECGRPTTAKEPVIMIGAQVGSWALQKLLGAGGRAEVYLAVHVVRKDLWAVSGRVRSTPIVSMQRDGAIAWAGRS